jgi:hypothetical protein
VMKENFLRTPKDMCSAFLEYAVKLDDQLRQSGQEYRIDDKTVFIIKRN